MKDMKSIGAVKISREETPMSKVKVASSFRKIVNNNLHMDWCFRLVLKPNMNILSNSYLSFFCIIRIDWLMIVYEKYGQSSIRASVMFRFDVDDNVQDDNQRNEQCIGNCSYFTFDQDEIALKWNNTKHK